MKFSELKSIGHNIADSLASGVGLPIGIYTTDVFGEAAGSQEGFITVDFLNGTTSGATPSPSLAKAVSRYAEALVDLCARHGTDVSAFRELSVRYASGVDGPRFTVSVEDVSGRRSSDDYVGVPGRRPKQLDDLGRVRPKPSTSTRRGG